ncbi:Peptidase propeptide and YPEB domain-containing protein [Rhizobium sp. RU20A]|uniref:PepSY domain-containing protein n=1 Tax=Rhizobium sp. RU20A TaxID=1907412 RepID=UPI000956A215|nr:PepSY domain-containing protein [Rhizobium sp. RU20A]SIQ34990.1 Peptidase propeptide and YPEB domain-containing protein [Rhizobium sp. RU20A]
MNMRNALVPTLAALMVCAPLTAARADRDPTPDERGRIESVLKTAGYVSWGDMEWDDDRWEIDDARDAAGKKFDLKLDDALTITQTEPDD